RCSDTSPARSTGSINDVLPVLKDGSAWPDGLRFMENRMISDSAPDHVRLALVLLRTVLPGRSAIPCPRHLPHVVGALDPFNAQALTKGPTGLEVVNEVVPST